jgi:zinc/manganese transport system ATP-binding protein
MIRLENVSVAYDRHPAVHHVSGTFKAGELTAVVGPNGAGKSTLLRAIVGAAKLEHGRVVLDGIARRDIAYLPQAAAIDRSFPISVGELVQLGHWRRVGAWAAISGKQRDEAAAALAAVGLDGFAGRPIEGLSIGQFQRVLFARLLLQDARVILLDEPFNAVDARTTADLVDVVLRWRAEQRTIVMVAHDHELVHRHCAETLLMARECIAWGPTSDVLTAQNQLRARAMAEAWAGTAPVCERDAA